MKVFLCVWSAQRNNPTTTIWNHQEAAFGLPFVCGFSWDCWHSAGICVFLQLKTQDEVENNSAYWLDIVDYDLDTAEAMYATGRWLYVGFMCHQVIEKVLKAYWCGTREDDPPYTHNHSRLAQGCGIWDEMSEEQKTSLKQLPHLILRHVILAIRKNCQEDYRRIHAVK